MFGSKTGVPIEPFVAKFQAALANRPSSLQGRFVTALPKESARYVMLAQSKTAQ